jgi:hypothetical protein
LRVSNDGNVTIGTSSADQESTRLQVQQTADDRDPVAVVDHGGASGYQDGLIVGEGNSFYDTSLALYEGSDNHVNLEGVRWGNDYDPHIILNEGGGNVGIGATTNPTNQLDIAGNLAVGSSYSGSNNAPSNGAIIEGDVGIGTNTPSTQLDVVGTSTFNGDSISDFTGNNLSISSGALNASGGSGSPGGSDTQVQFNNSGSFAGSSNFVWDYSNNRLGVGTSSPTNTIDVEGAAAIGSGYSGNQTAPTDGLAVAGNVGIGTTSPDAKLGITNATDTQPIATFRDDASTEMANLTNNGILELSGNGGSNVAIGNGASLVGGGFSQVVIGENAVSGGNENVAVGRKADTRGSGVAIGSKADANRQSIAIGRNADASKRSITLGRGASDLGRDQLVIGSDTYSIDEAYIGQTSNPLIYASSSVGVGLGTTSPDTQLHVVGTSTVTTDSGGELTLRRTNRPLTGQTLGETIFTGYDTSAVDAGASIKAVAGSNWNPDDTPTNLRFSTTPNGSGSLNERMRIDSNGHIGINTTYPGYKLDVVATSGTRVRGSSGGEQVLRLDGVGVSNGDTLGKVSFAGKPTDSSEIISGSIKGVAEGSWSAGGGDAPTSLRFSTTPSGSSSPSERVRITPSGNVGLGTTSPSTKFEVAGGTSTFANISVDDGAVSHSTSSGETSIDNIQLGAQTFDTNAGIVSWIDMPVTGSVATGTEESYTAQIDGQELLTIFSESDGSGGIQNEAVGVSTSSPAVSENLVVAGSGVAAEGSYNNLSSQRSIKTDFTDTRVLSGVDELDLVEWEYASSTAEEIEDDDRHLYPFAGDFYNKFGLGNGTSSISAFDISGVALKGVQEINGRIALENAPTSTPTITVASSSNVGVGTTSPAYDLQVDGTVAAESFVNVSTKDAKKGVENIGKRKRKQLADKMLGLDLKRYNYKSASSSKSKRLGVIAEQAPEEILSDSGKGVDLYEMTSATLASLQETSNTIESLQSQIDKQTADSGEVSTTVESTEPTAESIVSTVTGWLSDQATQIKNGVVAAVDGVFGTVTTNKLVIDSEPENGNTVSDQEDSTAGSGQIAENATSTVIKNNQVATTSHVILTFTSKHDGAYWVDKEDGEFAVNMDEKQQATTTFDYLVIGVKDATAKEVMTSTTNETDGGVAGTSTPQSGTTSSSEPDLGPLIDPDTYGTPPSEQEDDGGRPPTRSDDGADSTTSTTTATSTDTSTTTDDSTDSDNTATTTDDTTDTSTTTGSTTDGTTEDSETGTTSTTTDSSTEDDTEDDTDDSSTTDDTSETDDDTSSEDAETATTSGSTDDTTASSSNNNTASSSDNGS